MQLKQLLEYVSIISFTEKEAEYAATIRAKLETQGNPIGTIDGLIAGIALANNFTLVTRNVREFKHVDNLQLENWYDME